MSGSKLTILILGGAAAFAFGIALALSLWFDGGPVTASGDQLAAGETLTGRPGGPQPIVVSSDVTQVEPKHLAMLLKEARARNRDLNARETQLNQEEQRIRLIQQDLATEAEQLEALRVQLDTAATALRKAKVDLEKARITVAADEQKNLKRAAAIYDKMDAEAAARIIEDMCDNGQEEDAAKILHYMQDRTVAKLLAAIADKKKVARLNELMKRIHDEAAVS